ncbi:MAG TPA: hypothetical protein PKE29_17390 [Phycisphaerales bacterium]|mgnify:CR=1 FL=1|nr:hypothetical protein [Phycisphaerales bacterium]
MNLLRSHPKLLALNAALLAAIAVTTLTGSRPADAQTAAPKPGEPGARLRGEYTMIAGKFQGGTASVIYIIDAANQDLVAINWDRSNNRPNPLGHRSLLDDARYLTKPR